MFLAVQMTEVVQEMKQRRCGDDLCKPPPCTIAKSLQWLLHLLMEEQTQAHELVHALSQAHALVHALTQAHEPVHEAEEVENCEAAWSISEIACLQQASPCLQQAAVQQASSPCS